MVVVFFLLRTSPAVKLRVGHRVYSLSSVVGLFVSVLFDSILSVSLSTSILVSCSFLSLFSYSYSISTSLFVAFNCCFQHSHTTGKQTIISLITISLLLSLFLHSFHIFTLKPTNPVPYPALNHDGKYILPDRWTNEHYWCCLISRFQSRRWSYFGVSHSLSLLPSPFPNNTSQVHFSSFLHLHLFVASLHIKNQLLFHLIIFILLLVLLLLLYCYFNYFSLSLPLFVGSLESRKRSNIYL